MAIDLATKYQPYVDEVLTQDSKRDLITSKEGFTFDGAATVKIYRIGTSPMNDYGRTGPTGNNWSRYGEINTLTAETDSFKLAKDRSFTFVLDTLDMDETARALASAQALSRQMREVVIPEIDTHAYKTIVDVAEAGGRNFKAEKQALVAAGIYEQILIASANLDDNNVPEEGRVLIVPPETYKDMKKDSKIIMETDIGSEDRKRGVVGMIDGCKVIKVGASKLPKDLVFMMIHPMAAICPVKLEHYKIHNNPPGISGDLVEGRICYDTFVLTNKEKAVFCLTAVDALP